MTITLTRPTEVLRLPADATWTHTGHRHPDTRPCQIRPAHWWDVGDPNNPRAIDICTTCPFRADCTPADTADAAGTIRAGIAYNDRGTRMPPCFRCQQPMTTRWGSPARICQTCSAAEVNGSDTTHRPTLKRLPGVTDTTRNRARDHHNLVIALMTDPAEYTAAEIGWVIGCSGEAVKSYWRRYRANLIAKGGTTVDRRAVATRGGQRGPRRTA